MVDFQKAKLQRELGLANLRIAKAAEVLTVALKYSNELELRRLVTQAIQELKS
jgi:hypothetical protein